MKKSKPIIDQIDTVLVEHYGFTEAELDFIINYESKCRMGKALFDEASRLHKQRFIFVTDHAGYSGPY